MAKTLSNPSADATSTPSPPSAAEKRTRIYVGGLGESVTAEDLRKIFSNLGAVDGVDIVRTKGRSFGYVDFMPSSEKSLAKLFSAYNGCSWKGGKLKLEKAKEHYLDCLRREREENAAMENGAVSVDENQDTPSSKKAVGSVDVEKLQIRMFIPKLGKVKSLPYKGTGKHKYSFQRVEIPAIPLHFCACPDHSEAYQMESVHVDKQLKKSSEINKEEISMMRSIMNKLFEREKSSVLSADPPVHKEEDAKKLQELPPSDENLVDDGDDDDLILNVKHGHNNSFSSLESGKRVSEFVNEDKSSHGVDASEDLGKTRKRKALATNKKARSVCMNTHDNELSLVHKRKRNLQKSSDLSEGHAMPLTTKHGSMTNHEYAANDPTLQTTVQAEARSQTNRTIHNKEEPASSSLSGNEELSPIQGINHGKLDERALQPREVDLLSDTQPPNLGSSKPVKGPSWLQKCSWTQLVGNANGGSFSISQILPGNKFKELNSQTPDSARSSDIKFLNQKRVAKRNGQAAVLKTDGSHTITKPSNSASPDKVEQNVSQSGVHSEDGEKEVSPCNDPSASKSENISSESVHKTDKTIEISEICPFMRNAASVKEWKNAKSAVSASLKKKMKKVPSVDW